LDADHPKNGVLIPRRSTPLIREQAFGEALDPTSSSGSAATRCTSIASSNECSPCCCGSRTCDRGRLLADIRLAKQSIPGACGEAAGISGAQNTWASAAGYQPPLNQRVQGSNPCTPTNNIRHLALVWPASASQKRRLGSAWEAWIGQPACAPGTRGAQTLALVAGPHLGPTENAA
jgi:hypothetical protein